jgi:hypothetical protein
VSGARPGNGTFIQDNGHTLRDRIIVVRIHVTLCHSPLQNSACLNAVSQAWHHIQSTAAILYPIPPVFIPLRHLLHATGMHPLSTLLHQTSTATTMTLYHSTICQHYSIVGSPDSGLTLKFQRTRPLPDSHMPSHLLLQPLKPFSKGRLFTWARPHSCTKSKPPAPTPPDTALPSMSSSPFHVQPVPPPYSTSSPFATSSYLLLRCPIQIRLHKIL